MRWRKPAETCCNSARTVSVRNRCSISRWPICVLSWRICGRQAENRVTLRYQTLTSPVDGVIFDLKPTSSGYTAQSTETVMKVVPQGMLEAKVEVPSNKIGFVTVPEGCPDEPGRCMGGHQH